MDQRDITEEFNLPFIGRVLNEQFLLCAHESYTKQNFVGGELPLAGVLVLENQESSVFSRIVQTASISGCRVNLGPIFTRSAVGLAIKLVSWEIVQVHVAGVRVISKDILVKLDDLLEFSDVGFLVNMVLVHDR